MKTKRIISLVLIAIGVLLFTAIPITAQDQKPADTGVATPPPGTPAAPAAKPASDMLCFLLIGALMGATGQIGRAVVGIKKEMDTAAATQKKWDEWFNAKQLVVSVALGAAAGLLASMVMLNAPIDKKFLLGCVAAGYAGSDFIEGIMTKNLPG